MSGGQRDVTVTEILDERISQPAVGDVTLSEQHRMILNSELHKNSEAAVGVREFFQTTTELYRLLCQNKINNPKKTNSQ